MPTDCRTTDRNTNVGAVHPLSECAQSRDAFAPKAASGFWLADWILCGDIREDWRELLERPDKSKASA